ncbi:MAG: hypothetical protein J07HQW2_02579 [Haloquadratum walsbyi J07HQW2]|uniref:Uncharacterized protein n=1 Tax=Haloquadratum walsbyi J07HQW2 TaxID=1238425 RepID=U1NG66_9EURY|nr:MAG: hypothetical protein J07HQW2_02579 [Haloquadratum walsbyi J07HQW2]
MSQYENCDPFVIMEYVRMFSPEKINRPRACPNCKDKTRDGASVCEARDTRQLY